MVEQSLELESDLLVAVGLFPCQMMALDLELVLEILMELWVWCQPAVKCCHQS